MAAIAARQSRAQLFLVPLQYFCFCYSAVVLTHTRRKPHLPASNVTKLTHIQESMLVSLHPFVTWGILLVATFAFAGSVISIIGIPPWIQHMIHGQMAGQPVQREAQEEEIEGDASTPPPAYRVSALMLLISRVLTILVGLIR